jgi:2-dehydropantoate 2-reductase
MNKKIAVLGTGANGSCTAADLTNAGHDVVLIDQWPAHVEAMRTNGLTIEMPNETVHAKVRAYHLCDVCTLNEKYDIVFLMTKAYDARWPAEFIKPYLQEDGLLIGIQNAMTVNDIADIVGSNRTLGCVVELSSEVFTPGLVQRNTARDKTWFGIGSVDSSTEDRLPEIEALLQNVGKVTIQPNIMSAKWMKLVVNTMCLGPFAAMGLKLSETAELPGMRELALKAGTEALELGQHLGYSLEPIFGLTPDDIKGSNRLLEKLLDKLNHDIGPKARDCSLQDHLKGRYSEVDIINGLVVEEWKKRGKDAPANAAIVEISRRIHAGELKPERSNMAVAVDLLADSAAVGETV